MSSCFLSGVSGHRILETLEALAFADRLARGHFSHIYLNGTILPTLTHISSAFLCAVALQTGLLLGARKRDFGLSLRVLSGGIYDAHRSR